MAIVIAPARTSAAFADARRLFAEYAASIPIDLGYQEFAAELEALPGKYAPPRGELLLARDVRGEALGCVALRPLADRAAEMKRLYVAPAARGLKLGRSLVDEICARAQTIGYGEIRLDTLSSMTAAIALYESAGFARIAPYYATPIPDTVFLSRRFDAAASA